MAKTSSVSIGVTVTGDGQTSTYAPPGNPTQNTGAPNGGTVDAVLATGDNTIVLPAGAQGVVIVPPTGSGCAKFLKGVNGDTGISMHNAYPTVLHFLAGTASFVINAAAPGETVELHWT